MRKVALLLVALGLVACTTTSGSSRQVRLADLLIRDVNGQFYRYLDVVASALGTPSHQGLPVGRIWVGSIPDSAAWMRSYDFNRDTMLDEGEMTQGWLVKAAQEVSSGTFEPDSLMIYPQVASLLAQLPAPQNIRGVTLSSGEQGVVRGVLERGTGDYQHRTQLNEMLKAVDNSLKRATATGSQRSGGGGDGGGDD